MAKGVQNNKKHKDSSKQLNKSKLQKTTKLKISGSKNSKTSIVNESKSVRVLKAQQYKETSIKKNADSDYTQRGNKNNASLLCGIFPLFDFNDTDVILSLLKSTDKDAKIHKTTDIDGYQKLNSQIFTMQSKKFRKNFTFTSCSNFRDRFDYLDMAKIVDWAIFVLPNDFDELIGDYTADLLASLIAQGLPSSCFCILSDLDVKRKSLAKAFVSITKLNLDEFRITSLTNLNDATKLMHRLAVACKPSYISTTKAFDQAKSIHKKRGYFMAEHFQFDNENNRLSVVGCMRGFGMDLTSVTKVHLTDVGDFPILKVDWKTPEMSNRFSNVSPVKTCTLIDKTETTNGDVEAGDEEMESEDEGMESEDGEEEGGDGSSESERVSGIDSDHSEHDNNDKMSFASTANTGYSLAQIQKFRESREDSMFPDEIEVECTVPVRERLKKYRGVVAFKSSIWPTNEDIPKCYEDIHQLRKYKHDRNRLCNNLNSLDRSIDLFVQAGSQFSMVIGGVTEQSRRKIEDILARNPQRHLIGSNLFATEDSVSVLHLNQRRLASVDDSAVSELAKTGDTSNNNDANNLALGEEPSSGNEVVDPSVVLEPKAEPIESKETMLFQIGFRRFTGTPIYSEFDADSDETGSKGKAKYMKFMEPKRNVVATLYGPISYGPVSVLQFRLRQTDLGYEESGPPYVAELVASGNLLSIDHTRPILKRVLLSGQIYKVNKRSVMVRYMFFNVDDIEQYKAIPLHTKNGRKGRIVKACGTHGYMKCSFDKPLTQADVVLMPLYKRVFPKYTVASMYDSLPDSEQVQGELAEAMDTMF